MIRKMIICFWIMLTMLFVVPMTAKAELIPLGTYKLTAYCGGSCCNGKWAGQTASGAPLQEHHTIATSAKEFPFGTVLVINGEEYVVEDRGVGPGVIDIYHASHSAGNRFGIQYAEVYLKK